MEAYGLIDCRTLTPAVRKGMMMSKPRRRGWHDVDKTDIRVSELVQQFLMYQEDSNHSPKTVRWYSDMLGRFAASLQPEARLRDIDATSIRVYLHDNRQNGASKFTLHARMLERSRRSCVGSGARAT